MKLIAAGLYQLTLMGALMYVVGYLGWSAWWLLLLAFSSTYRSGG